MLIAVAALAAVVTAAPTADGATVPAFPRPRSVRRSYFTPENGGVAKH
jgi:hypothetical protein